MSYDILKKVVLIMNGSSEIGRVIARDFADEGASVIIHGDIAGKESHDVEEAFLDIDGLKIPFMMISSKVSDFHNILVAKVLDRHERIDIFIYIQPFIPLTPFKDIRPGDWQNNVISGLKSLFCISKAVGKHMAKNKSGKMLFIVTGVGAKGEESTAENCAFGAGVMGFNKSLSREYLSYNIQTNCIAFGPLEQHFQIFPEDFQNQLKKASKYIGVKRLCKPEDISSASLFLSSKGGDHIVGQTLHLNGGLVI
ncbi:MAG: SDR family oxidoreductase [Oligoflexales bacterium]|nr:SDR family oxidoreductase [Oligoflexales bacterium]